MAASRRNNLIRARGSRLSPPTTLGTYLNRNNPASVALTFVPQVPGYLPPPRITPFVPPRYEMLINGTDEMLINNNDTFIL